MKKIKGFDTLKAKEINGKFYIYSLAHKTCLNGTFDTIEELEKYVDEKYTGEYC